MLFTKEARLSVEHRFSREDAERIGDEMGLDWSEYDLDEFTIGMNVELEHGTHDPATNVTDDDPVLTAKIALAHLNELPDYYTRLTQMEAQAQ